MKNKKKLLAIYFNEFNPDYLLKGAKKYKCSSILKILKLNKIKTFTNDKKQDFNLDPWVQSVSINTGKSSAKHKIYKIGQFINKDLTQIWDVLSKNKISCSIWGAMNSTFKENNYINYYFPDPWNFRDKAFPSKLMGLYYLPNYYAKNYLKVNIFKLIYYSLIFLFRLLLNIKIFSFFKDLIFSIKVFFKKGLKNYILFFLYDLIFLNLYSYSFKKNRSSFSLIFLNSIAHYQHNNWNEKSNEKYFFMYAERIFTKILELKKECESIIIFNGFTQKKISKEYLLRPHNPEKFLSKFIKYKKLEQDMTTGGLIFFNNKKEKKASFDILNKLYFLNKKLFYIKNNNGNNFFYKINLKSKIVFNKDNLKFFKNNKGNNLFEILKVSKIINSQRVDASEYIINNISFLKSTGSHIPEGIFLYDNFDVIKNKKKIKNHKIFNLILKFYDI